METPEIIDGLKDLIKDRNSFIDQNEPDNVFEHDKEILKATIDALSAAPKNKSLTVLKCQDCINSESFNGMLICSEYGGIWDKNDGCTHGIYKSEGSEK